MINQNKKVLRAEFQRIRASVYDRNTKNEDITNFLIESDEYKYSDKVYAYWSVGSEVETQKIILKALDDNKMVALPKCIDKDGNMKFYYIASVSDLVDGMYGIKEPREIYPADDFTNKSLCIVPALSFAEDGYRLGYGKGYYDRFLSKFTGVSIGLCFSDCLCEKLPADSYDKKVNYIVTNEKIYDIR